MKDEKYYVIFNKADKDMIGVFRNGFAFFGSNINTQLTYNYKSLIDYLSLEHLHFAIPISKKEFEFLKGREYNSPAVVNWKEKRFPELML